MELAEEVQVVCWVPLHHWGEEEATGKVLVLNERSVVKKNFETTFLEISEKIKILLREEKCYKKVEKSHAVLPSLLVICSVVLGMVSLTHTVSAAQNVKEFAGSLVCLFSWSCEE